jgi:hypothetical protein
MAYQKKTWEEKLVDKKGYPKVLRLEEGFPCYKALHKMGAEVGDDVILVNASEVFELMKLVPEGKLATLSEICKEVAKRHGTKACCTLTSGIFVMTAANAVEEAARSGRDLKIPYWRTLKIGGYLNDKYPGGVESHGRLLRREGHKLIGKGKSSRVEGYEFVLFKF